MIWLTWRQFRAQALTALTLLAAAGIALLITGLHLRHTLAADVTACAPRHVCGEVLSRFGQGYQASLNVIQVLVIAAPGLIGIFWGAPLIGRELETGTHQLAWNQTVTRTRWFTMKLVCVGAASVVTAGVLSYLLTWWAGPLDHISGSRFAALAFGTRDIAPLGYAAFAFALGTTAGLLLRRTIPAMAVTLAIFIGLQLFVPAVVRPHLLPSTTANFPVDQATAAQATGIYTSGGGTGIFIAGLPVPRGAWVLAAPPIEDPSGQVVAAGTHSNCLFPDSGGPGKGGVPDLDRIAACLARYDLHETVTYQPANHYWPLQWYEAAIFFGLAALLAGISFWRISSRHLS